MSDDDDARRRQEINMFAAMAQADASGYSSNTFGSDSFAPSASANSAAPENASEERNMFSQAASQIESSGTFNLKQESAKSRHSSSSSNSNVESGRSYVKSHNLEAAAAALAFDDDDDDSKTTGDPPLLSPRGKHWPPNGASNIYGNASGVSYQNPETQRFPKLRPRTSMHTQQVYMPKPLFFGHAISPRIVQEARDILQQQPKNKPYSAEVRNMLSAIRTYGHGLDLLKENSKSTAYVSVFCPKWSEELPPDADPDSMLQPPEGLQGDPDSLSGEISESTNDPPNLEQSQTSNGVEDDLAFSAATTTSLTADTGGNMSERDLFSMWARGDDGSTGSPPPPATTPTTANNSGHNRTYSISRPTMITRENSTGSNNSTSSSINSQTNKIKRNSSVGSNDTPIMSDRDLFSQWARGEVPRDVDVSRRSLIGTAVGGTPVSSSDTFNAAPSSGPSTANSSVSGGAALSKQNSANNGSVNFFNSSGTFMNVPGAGDSDDDEVVVSELKKKVGMNEHLNAALAFLEEDIHDGPNGGSRPERTVVEESNDTNSLAQVPLTADGGRPLTNHELMNGVAPLFGCDDSSLPTEADLGIHETRDEQQRSKEQQRNQAIIENLCPQNIFGPLACPNPALHPDDNHSWNSRTIPTQPRMGPSSIQGVPRTVTPVGLGVLPTPEPGSRQQSSSSTASARRATSASSSPKPKTRPAPSVPGKKFDSQARYGWWCVSDKDADIETGSTSLAPDSLCSAETVLQLPPQEHPATNILIQTKLEPQPEKLQEQNRPLSHLHPATTLAQTLPFLSDRPPSYRYLQIDTQAVGFPVLGGEIEPFFCSLAIYNVETAVLNSTNDPSMSPIPDLQRCGKITETLTFDVVSDSDIEERCRGALWPYQTEDTAGDRLQGTRCGVFPLPSNLNIHNLYAILIVHKVVSEGSDFDVYLRPDKTAFRSKVDLDLMRSRAEKSSAQQGKFIMPFAFGVAPLLQVFGADVPVVPSSRAVQIPLFRFAAGKGDRQIIDHIMVMLYPRADHRSSGIGGPAQVTNGGTAMLVMRNFGYLGLHSVVHNKSSLARDRLVDFTREIQLRRKEEFDMNIDYPFSEEDKLKLEQNPDVHVLPPWHSAFVAEPAKNGGRIKQNHNSTSSAAPSKSESPLYAQEMSPLRLHPSPQTRSLTSSLLQNQRGRNLHPSGEDIEPFYHTTFCNELLCHPRLLHNCPKGNIVIKVEMRDIEWKPEYGAYFARLPSHGPAVHNPRRGPFMIQSCFSTCSARCVDPHFLDEFKIKLPLVLNGTREGEANKGKSCLLFTVYRLSFSSRKKWGKLFRSKVSAGKTDEIAGVLAGESNEQVNAGTSCHLIQLACGYLPLSANSSVIVDGNHDIKLKYQAWEPKRDIIERGEIEASTIILCEAPGVNDTTKPESEEFLGDDTESVGSSHYLAETASAASGTESAALSEKTDVSKKKVKGKASTDSIVLQVRVSVHSSVHCQNPILGEFLGQEPITPLLVDKVLEKTLKLGREEIRRRMLELAAHRTVSESQYEADRLLTSTIDIAKDSMCPLPEVTEHLLRVVNELWKIVVCGTGESSIQWANPASLLPLRVQAFATLLHTLASFTIYSSKRGLTQLDGSNKLNLITTSRIFSLSFDEGELFGEQAQEPPCPNFFNANSLQSMKGQRNSIDKPSKKHVRSNFEFLNNGSTTTDVVDNMKTLPSVPISSTSRERNDPFSTVSSERNVNKTSTPDSIKVDTVTDFRSALKAGSMEVEDDDPLVDSRTRGGSGAAAAMIQAYSGPPAGSRRWMTAPAPHLATIREDGDDGDMNDTEIPTIPSTRKPKGPLDALDTELFVKPSKSTVKQMRVPKTRKNKPNTTVPAGSEETSQNTTGSLSSAAQQLFEGDTKQEPTATFTESPNSSPNKEQKISRPQHIKQRSQTLPVTDAEIESAGTSFLDAIEKSLGLGGVGRNTATGENDRVGQSHHRKTRSSCSIDWSIPNDDIRPFVVAVPTPETPVAEPEVPSFEWDDSMSTLAGELQISTMLPNYLDRLASVGAAGAKSGRWFPFVYEIVIMQWAALLNEQRLSDPDGNADKTSSSSLHDRESFMADAASRTFGVSIACAPVLFEVIKQSLGWRVANLFRRPEIKDVTSKYTALVTLDDTMMASFEQIISLITDICINSRNFDSWETRQTCIDVNDSIVRFIRDLYAFLDPTCVYRLTRAYLSRLMATGGKWQDRDSSIGLRCSWEVTKLQLNAVATLVRFPDFLKINSPQFNTVGDCLAKANVFSTASFFDDMLTFYGSLNPRLLEGGLNDTVTDPQLMRCHWLAEIVVDICLLGVEHVEQNIQRRSSSLLHELFWCQSQGSMREGNASIVATMYITLLEKVLTRTNYLSSCFSPKSQVRQDVLRCVVFVLQSAPAGLLRALWRKLCKKAAGRNYDEKYGGIGYTVFSDSADDTMQENQRKVPKASTDWKQEADIFEMFSILNLCLATFEYEGSDAHVEADSPIDEGSYLAVWRKEFLLSREPDTTENAKRRRLMAAYGKAVQGENDTINYSSTSSRKWHSHDSSIVVIKSAQHIVRELRNIIEPSEDAQNLLNPARKKSIRKSIWQNSTGSGTENGSKGEKNPDMPFSYTDTVIFVRAATSVYLHSLTLRHSDITLVKTLNASLEMVKIFGIKIFNEAVGETLQHWMRVVSFHCGSRRAEVRIQASDFLELILRSTWDAFGSFFRIRLPLLAVQTEVIERIVATAATRHYREQRMMGIGIDFFSNGSAEASLAPLWRTLDRLHHQSASQNVAFRSALIRLAEKLKKLFRAYVAAHALSFLNKAKAPEYTAAQASARENQRRSLEAEMLVRASRISIHRVINASAGYSKQFLGFNSTSLEHCTVAHNEAVEDAFLAAADVFSPTELPDHRVAWLRKLAEFHSSRRNYAEEATCHYNIHITMLQASTLHGSLWSSTPFLPWTNNMSNSIHLDGEGPAGDPDDGVSLEDAYNNDIGRQIEKTNSFRRIFYRNENSIRVSGGELEAGASKYVFCGVTLPMEYTTVTPWSGLRDLEAHMLEEAESSADLYLKAGIVFSSRYARSLAVSHYSNKFNYVKLEQAYAQLARTVVSQIPPLDSGVQEVCVTAPLGRFYRVWFHGGAPDELIGAEFVYRTGMNVRLERFGKELKEVIRCIIPDKTPIHLVLDGRPEEREEQRVSMGFRMGAQLEPVRVKVTPLRSMVSKSSKMRGLPEWFHDYIDATGADPMPRLSVKPVSRYNETNVESMRKPGHREHGPSYSASVFTSSSGSVMQTRRSGSSGNRWYRQEFTDGELVGADKFSFMQPINKGRGRARDWLRGSSGDFAEKSLRVTQLQVGQAFPACVSRQPVVHRVVFTQSPLEAASDSLCQWCAILYRTGIATNGQAVLGINYDPGIGIEAAKVVADCIHSSRVKEMGLYLLKKNTNFREEDDGDGHQSYDRLSEDEVKKFQLRLARSLIVFMELLHLMIARNRDLLLDVIQERKRGENGSRHGHTASLSRDFSLNEGRSNRSLVSRQSSMNANDGSSLSDGRLRDDMTSRSYHRPKGSTSHGPPSSGSDDYSTMSGIAAEKARTDSAIGIQSELQRAFISLAKELHPMINGVLGPSTPRWLKLCTQENYFSAYTYRLAKLPMAEELTFEDIGALPPMAERPPIGGLGPSASSRSHSSGDGLVAPINAGVRSSNGTRTPVSPGGSLGSGSVVSRGSDAGRSQSGMRSVNGKTLD